MLNAIGQLVRTREQLPNVTTLPTHKTWTAHQAHLFATLERRGSLQNSSNKGIDNIVYNNRNKELLCLQNKIHIIKLGSQLVYTDFERDSIRQYTREGRDEHEKAKQHIHTRCIVIVALQKM